MAKIVIMSTSKMDTSSSEWDTNASESEEESSDSPSECMSSYSVSGNDSIMDDVEVSEEESAANEEDQEEEEDQEDDEEEDQEDEEEDMGEDDSEDSLSEDDMHNSWGVDLIPDAALNNLDEYAPNRHQFKSLQRAVNYIFKPFQFYREFPSGSDAIQTALVTTTNGFLDRAVMPCGSYVSGDGSVLQGYSTSFYNVTGYAEILPPNHKFMSPNGHKVTLPFPYHIQGCMTDDSLLLLEDQCFHELKICYFTSLMNGVEIKVILMEIILAGVGASLSNRYFTRLGKFCKRYKISVILDEILTSGRTGGSMLMWFDLPQVLQQAVCFVVVAKWMECGMILLNPHNTFSKGHIRDIKKLPIRGFPLAFIKIDLFVVWKLGMHYKKI